MTVGIGRSVIPAPTKPAKAIADMDPDAIADADDDEYTKLVLAEMHDRATDRVADAFRADEASLREWRDKLNELVKRVDAKFTELKADAIEKQQECLKRGPLGKSAWFDYKATNDRERARLAAYRRRIDDRLRESKRLIGDVANEPGGSSATSYWAQQIGLLTEVRDLLKDILAELREDA